VSWRPLGALLLASCAASDRVADSCGVIAAHMDRACGNGLVCARDPSPACLNLTPTGECSGICQVPCPCPATCTCQGGICIVDHGDAGAGLCPAPVP
jgi:hypothetical protein